MSDEKISWLVNWQKMIHWLYKKILSKEFIKEKSQRLVGSSSSNVRTCCFSLYIIIYWTHLFNVEQLIICFVVFNAKKSDLLTPSVLYDILNRTKAIVPLIWLFCYTLLCVLFVNVLNIMTLQHHMGLCLNSRARIPSPSSKRDISKMG